MQLRGWFVCLFFFSASVTVAQL